MRNPINSIKSQSIKQGQINEKLRFLLQKDFDEMHQSQVKMELQAILNESCDTVKVQESSSKILCFLVNDILDFA